MICPSVPESRPSKQSFLLLPDGRKPSKIPEHERPCHFQGVADIRGLFNYFTGLQPSVAQRESKALPSEFLTTIPSHLLEPPSGRLVGGEGQGGSGWSAAGLTVVSAAWECCDPRPDAGATQ